MPMSFVGQCMLMHRKVSPWVISMLEFHYIAFFENNHKKRLILKYFKTFVAFGLDCVLVVVMKNCKIEVSCKLSNLLDISLKESCFPDCWKSCPLSL